MRASGVPRVSGVRAAEVEHYGGRLTPDAAAVFADWVEVAEGWVKDRDRVREEGWDVAALLRQQARLVAETAAAWARGARRADDLLGESER